MSEPAPTPMPTRIETGRLVLRPWQESDAEGYRQMWVERDPRSVRVIDADGHPTVAELAESLRHQVIEMRRTGIGFLAVERDGELVGYCGLLLRDPDGPTDEPEIGYEFLRRAFGHGYATEAAGAIVAAARASGRRALRACVRDWNLASFRVLDKLGFVRSGQVEPDADRGDSVWLRVDLSP